ncbi:MAG: MFS transporter [Rhodospirillales bacterium]|nr:MFS transporter [Rhodospirillales bacterium]
MLPLFLIVFIDLVGFGIIIPLLPFYAESFDASPFIVGLLMASYSAAQLVTAPVWGRLSDRWGRRPVMLLTIPGLIVSYLWLGVADSLWMLFAARTLGGLMAGNIATAFAYMADVTTRETRARGMGLIGAAFGLGFITGPAIGGLLAGADPVTADFHTPSFAAALLSAVAWIATVFLLEESRPRAVRERAKSAPDRRSLAETLRHPRLGLLIGLSFMTTFVFAGLEATFALWSHRRFGWGPEQNGYLFAGVGLTSALVQGVFVGRMARAFGERHLMMQGALALGAGLALVPFASHVAVLVGALLLAGYGFSLITPALNSLISFEAADDQQGAVMGVTRSAITAARVAGPAWAGLLFSWLGPDWPFYAGALVMGLVAFLITRVIAAAAHAASTAKRASPENPA